MKKPIKCVLIDDELPGLSYLRTICSDFPDIEVVRAFSDPLKLVEQLNELEFDLAVLDIRMPGMDGLELASILKDQGKLLIFTTAFKEFAAEAFDLEAVDYIRKPIAPDRLEKAFQKAAERLAAQAQSSVVLNSNRGKILLKISDVVMINSSDTDRRDKLVLLRNSDEVILKNISFSQLLEILPSDRFCRINRTTILSVDRVRTFTHDYVWTDIRRKDGSTVELPLSEQYRPAFRLRTRL